MFRKIFPAILVLIGALTVALPAYADTAEVQTVWRLLDYIAVDYPGAVENGKVISEGEFKEMVEFSGSARERLSALPETSAKPALLTKAGALEASVKAMKSGAEIAVLARGLAADLLIAYPVPLAPAAVPDVARGKALYAENCAICHGEAGNGHGPGSVGLDPPPVNFTDRTRARERSIFALYQVIELGLDGTSMASFAHLPVADRWALAFYVGGFAYPASDAAKGEEKWKNDPAVRAGFTLKSLVGTTPHVLADHLGEATASEITAYLRHNPGAVTEPQTGGQLTLARSRLNESVAAYERGDKNGARDLALSAYLDGFEPVEPSLSARDKPLMIRIEKAMGELRAGIAKGAPPQTVRGQIAALDGLFAQAEIALGQSDLSSGSSFVAAFTILLREGLEAMLIVIAMIAFLNRADRRDVLGYVHAGWTTALLAGAATWGAATYFITISGASRELTEGFGSVFAAVVLVWVGIWMHGKSNAVAWQIYIREKLSHALTQRSAWFLFLLAFVVVYREVFETILFYAAIWNQGNGGAVLAGAGAAAALIVLIGVVMMRFSKTLPISEFFSYSSALIAVLAVVLIGKGVAALQEAGIFQINPLHGWPRVEILGIYPTLEGVSAQVVVAVLLALGFFYNARKARALEQAG